MNAYLEDLPNDAWVVRQLMETVRPHEISTIIAEIDELLAQSRTAREPSEMLDVHLRSFVNAWGLGLTPQEWLERLRDWLVHGVPQEALASREGDSALVHASTFTDEAEAELAVAKTIAAHEDDIAEWFRGQARRYRMDHDVGRPIGTLARYDSEEEFHPTSVRVIIVRDPEFEPSGWRILTGYPVLRVGRAEARQQFPTLDLLFGCYFNQDWQDIYSHPRFVIEAFATDNPRHLVEAALGELPALRALPLEDQELGDLLIYDLGAEYAASRLGKTYSQFLMEIEAFLGKSLSP